MNMLNHPLILRRRQSALRAMQFRISLSDFEERLIKLASKYTIISSELKGSIEVDLLDGHLSVVYKHDGDHVLNLTAEYCPAGLSDEKVFKLLITWFKE